MMATPALRTRGLLARRRELETSNHLGGFKHTLAKFFGVMSLIVRECKRSLLLHEKCTVVVVTQAHGVNRGADITAADRFATLVEQA
jgi:hypothetical protein